MKDHSGCSVLTHLISHCEMPCQNDEITNLALNIMQVLACVPPMLETKDGSTLLTSSAFVRPYSSVWRLGETQEHMYDLAEEIHLEYGRRGSDKILGTSSAYETNEGIATIYDTESGTPIVKMWKQGEPQRYRRNLAHFAPDDRMVLHDGQLWDPRCATEPLHTFDLFGYVASGDFHPHGNEVIINAQVWDLRTYKLLRSIPALDQCKLTFSSTGNIFYAIKREEDREDSSFRDTYTSKFWSYDSILYEQIAEVDVRKPLLGFCLDHTDQRVAVVERTSRDEEGYRSLESSAVKFYEIGKLRIPEEDGEEEVDPEAVGSEYSSSAEESSDFDDEDEEEDEDEDEDDANDDADGSESGSGEGGSLSSGWELDENADAPMNSEAGSGTSDDSDEDEDDDVDDDMEDGQDFFDLDDSDEEYEEEPDSRGQGSSSIVLNPHLRRARRRDASERDDEKIWFRNFQIVDETLQLQEIGPRFVLELIRIFNGSFEGAVLYDNPNYEAPNDKRRMLKIVNQNKYVNKKLHEKVQVEKDISTKAVLKEKVEDPAGEIFNAVPSDEAAKLVAAKMDKNLKKRKATSNGKQKLKKKKAVPEC
ncbi:unnamed protein product, partial [Mesorhabditis spiculigera]